MLFVGFNPRVSATNINLHRQIVADRSAFVQLAHNRVGENPYIAPKGDERHYRIHARIVREATRGTDKEGSRFEEIAVATELFLCATEKQTPALRHALADGSAKCPELHYRNILLRAQPKVVITLGDDVFAYVRKSSRGSNAPYRIDIASQPVIIAIPHPSRRQISDTEINRIGSACRSILLGDSPDAWDFRGPHSVDLLAKDREIRRICYWSDNKGWHLAHRKADLEWMEADSGRTIRYDLYRNDALMFTLRLSGQQLRAAIGPYVDGPGWPRSRGYNNPVTRRINGVRTQVFLPQWEGYVSRE
jgi:hypothetical protein